MDTAAIRARLAAATPEPWRRGTDHKGIECVFTDNADEIVIAATDHSGMDFATEDAEFIAHSRADLAALLAEVVRLREAVERVRAALLEGGQTAAIRSRNALAALSPVGDTTTKETR